MNSEFICDYFYDEFAVGYDFTSEWAVYLYCVPIGYTIWFPNSKESPPIATIDFARVMLEVETF